jgi:hypothetical protein
MKAGDANPTEQGRCKLAAAAIASGIRWDAVVDPRLANIGRAQHCTAPAAMDRPADSIQVHVQLFGALAAHRSERSVWLEQAAGTRIIDILAAAEERLGASLLVHVLDESGSKRRHCRLFVGGYAVEDPHTPLAGTANPTEIDIILLIAPEGG